MIFAALSEAAERGELLLAANALCRYHRRRDGVLVIREILVLPHARRTGIGRRLVRQVQDTSLASPLVVRCPVGLPANGFWMALGFRLVEATVKGVNVWRRDPSSSSAPTGTGGTPTSP